MRVTDSPSIVPAPPSDSDLAAAVSLLVTLAHAKREGDVDALNDAAHLFDSIPGLRGAVHSMAVGASHSEVQGARSRDRKHAYARRKVARAREYQQRRRSPDYSDISDSELKSWCGQRLVRDPADGEKYLKTLQRRQAIKAIDEGLALIATGRFVLSSR